MARSPAREHYIRTLAAQEAAKRAAGQIRPDATLYEQMLAKLHQDRLRLKQVQSGEAKGALKAELLPEYFDYLHGVLEADAGGEDEVMATCMVWAIDGGRFDVALQLAGYVLKHKLALPDRFTRTVGCVVAEEIAEAALKKLAAGETFDELTLNEAGELTSTEDMPDEVRAKLHMATGRVIMRDHDPETAPQSRALLGDAVMHLRRAIELHNACGAKKDLERAERALKNAPPAQPSPTTEPPPPAAPPAG